MLVESGEIDQAVEQVKVAQRFHAELPERDHVANAILQRAFERLGSDPDDDDLEGLTNLFEQALDVNPTMELQPESIKRKIVSRKIHRAQQLSASDDIDGASLLFEQALAIDPNPKFGKCNPQTRSEGKVKTGAGIGGCRKNR